jgi:hypothetical protein
MKQEKIREKQLEEQKEARRLKNVVKKEKRIAKKLAQFGGAPAKQEKEVAPKKEEAPKEQAAKKGAAAQKKQAEPKAE